MLRFIIRFSIGDVQSVRKHKTTSISNRMVRFIRLVMSVGIDLKLDGDRFRNNLTTVFSSRAYHAGLYNDSDDGSAVNPVDALIALGFNYNDMQAGLSMSSSSAAAADYFVDEPDPEPEPDES